MIRQFQPEDADACCTLVHACLAIDPQLSCSLYNRLRNIESPQAMRRRSTLFYMAVYESCNRVIGVAGLDMNEVRLLYVSPEHQSHGIGGKLLSHLEAMVPSSAFADIFLYSTPSAAGFYSHRGFKGMGEYSFDLNGELLKTIFMIKLLRPLRQEARKKKLPSSR